MGTKSQNCTIIKNEKPDLVHCWLNRAANFTYQKTVPVLGWFGGYYDLKYYNLVLHGRYKDIVRYIGNVTKTRCTYIGCAAHWNQWRS